MVRRFCVGLLCALCPLAFAAPVLADGGGANNVVIVQTTADGTSRARAGVEAVSFGGPSALSTNLADATASSCTGCRSVAVAVQAVFLTGDPSTVAPTNAAVAANAGCSGCVSFAYAYQYVVTTAGQVYLSPQARVELDVLRSQFDAVASSGEPVDQLRSDLDRLAAQFRAAVDGGLVQAGTPPVAAAVHEQVDES